jgi:hypothetical protein
MSGEDISARRVHRNELRINSPYDGFKHNRVARREDFGIGGAGEGPADDLTAI